MIKLLNPVIKKFTHIIHIADIHIRLNKRGDEYRHVFSNLYKEISNSPETTVVAILGDTLHNKVDLSPECIQLATEFFKNIANLRPTILIAGNHDAILSNKSRLDSITPIIDALNHPNLYYLKDTGLYGFGNILWNNMSVFDTLDKYIQGNNIPLIYKNEYTHIIALFHGAVDQASSDTGYFVSNPEITNSLFDGNDIALLGDIHKIQNMQEYDCQMKKPCIRYCGSLIQQNNGENLYGHGYSLWDLSNYSYKHVEVNNEYGYFTINLNKGVFIDDLKNMPKKVRLNVKCFQTTNSEVKDAIAKIKEISDVVETSFVRIDQDETQNILQSCNDIVLSDLQNVDYQGNLISDFLKSKLGISDDLQINRVLDINKKINISIKKEDVSRNLKWKAIKFEWHNMFRYAEDNVIDFTKLNGVYGIFGNNRVGKSSVLSAILFCLFDKFERGFKGEDVLNVKKSSFSCKFEFEISDIRYFIKREGTLKRDGSVKVTVDFWRHINGADEQLHGTDRRDTYEVIREYIGSYEDFVMTYGAFQNAKNYVSFIDMRHSDRKDLLVQFIGLSVFDKLSDAASDRNKEFNSLLKIHKDKNYADEKLNAEQSLSYSLRSYNEKILEIEKLEIEKQEINDEIAVESGKLITLDTDVPTNLELLNKKHDEISNSIKQKTILLENLKLKLNECKASALVLNSDISKLESSNLVESHKKLKEIKNTLNGLNSSFNLKDSEYKTKLRKQSLLKDRKYDPNCKFCIDNDFIRDATQAINQIGDNEKELKEILENKKKIEDEQLSYMWVETAYEKYTNFLNDKSKLKDEYSKTIHNITISENELEKLKLSMESVIKQKELYHRNEISVQNNFRIQNTVQEKKKLLIRNSALLNEKNSELRNIISKKTTFENQIETLSRTIEDIKVLEMESKSYQLYLNATGRDGIPYQIICNTVPLIQKEVNNILNQIIDYTIEFETDGKNIIPYISLDQSRWPIEMSSGFERFAASIAIRMALMKVSNLPAPNFMFIDEGFGALDIINLSNMSILFSFLKNNFDFIFVISHLDTLKDTVEKQIEIKNNGTFSSVSFN